MLLDELHAKKDKILSLCGQYGARRIRVFGSVSRGEERLDSDIDFLVDLEYGRSLLDLGGLLFTLERLLGCKVDIVTEKGLHWYLRDKIIKEAKPL